MLPIDAMSLWPQVSKDWVATEEHRKPGKWLIASGLVEECLAVPDRAGVEGVEFLTIAADQRQRHDLTFLQSASAGDPRVTEVRDVLHKHLETLVDRARMSGAIRADITEADVFLMMCAPIHIVENLAAPPPLLWQRYLAIIFDGLRTDGARPLPQPAPVAP